MDVSAQATMKDAAKCDKRCEWQNSANQENVERILRFSVTPESMSSSGLLAYHVANDAVVSTVSWYTFLCASDVELSGSYRWRIKFNGFYRSLTITLRAKLRFSTRLDLVLMVIQSFFLLA